LVKPVKHILFFGLLAVVAAGHPVLAMLTQKEFEAKITESKILQPGDEISLITIRGEEVLVDKRSQSKELDKDCKLDAVLVSKVVMTMEPSIKRVIVRFFEEKESSRYLEVMVRVGDLEALAASKVSQDDLLASLNVTSGTAPGGDTTGSGSSENSRQITSVVAGPQQDERAAVLKRIGDLNAKGVNTQAYMKRFTMLEELAKSGDKSATADALNKLSISVSDQEKALARRGQRNTQKSAPATSVLKANAPPPANTPPSVNAPPAGGEQDSFEHFIFGEFQPVDGPYHVERCVISHRIKSLVDNGSNPVPLRKMVNDLNNLTRKKLSAKVWQLIVIDCQTLGIKESDFQAARRVYAKGGF
jgi:hypothetical protein